MHALPAYHKHTGRTQVHTSVVTVAVPLVCSPCARVYNTVIVQQDKLEQAHPKFEWLPQQRNEELNTVPFRHSTKPKVVKASLWLSEPQQRSRCLVKLSSIGHVDCVTSDIADLVHGVISIRGWISCNVSVIQHLYTPGRHCRKNLGRTRAVYSGRRSKGTP